MITRYGKGDTRDNLLDLVITTDSSSLVADVNVIDSHFLSDHRLVICDLNIGRVKSPPVTRQTRNIRGIDRDDFQRRLHESEIFTKPADSADEFLDQIETVTSALLDTVAPIRSVHCPNTMANRRLSPEAAEAKRDRRQLERRWKATNKDHDKQAYRSACKHANDLINKSRDDQIKTRIEGCGQNSRRKWNEIKKVLHPPSSTIKRSRQEEEEMSRSLADFFRTKILKIKTAIIGKLGGTPPDPLSADGQFSGNKLDELSSVTVEEVLQMLSSLPGKASPMDFIPTVLLKDCSGVFAPIIARLANLSFLEGSFPTRFKTAQVTPLLKKDGLDPNGLANYRPISNLNTISKILERLFQVRLIPHVTPCLCPLQSAYRKFHSTETALLRILTDMFESVDRGYATVLVALDLSAAFDTIDHSVLVNRLEKTFGITGSALRWISSYLTGRSSFVKIGNNSSATTPSDTGVPQGSVLGPILFSLFTTPLGAVLGEFGVKFHQYADDTQIYLTIRKENVSDQITNIADCTTAVYQWLLHNSLALNPEKSEAAIFGTWQRVKPLKDLFTVNVAGAPINLSEDIKSLGVTFDTQLSFDNHVNNVCRGAHYHIRGLRNVRTAMSKETANTIACSLVTSRLDYCNALLAGMSETNLNRLQRVQNALARVVCRTRRRDHITPALAELHWLPIRSRISYKIATITHKIRTTQQPGYLVDLIEDAVPSRTLRSKSGILLKVPMFKTQIGQRSFRYIAATTWNSLPDNIRTIDNFTTFKKHLKTHLYNLSYTT